jgi:hypothetical protein
MLVTGVLLSVWWLSFILGLIARGLGSNIARPLICLCIITSFPLLAMNFVTAKEMGASDRQCGLGLWGYGIFFFVIIGCQLFLVFPAALESDRFQAR